MERGAFHLAHGLTAEHTVEFAVVACDLAQGLHITSVEQLTDARGVVHRLVLQGGEAVVEHGVRHVQVAVFEFCLADVVVEHLEAVLPLLFAQEPVVEAVAVVEQIISRDDGEQHEHEQDDGDGLVGLRLLHRAAVVTEGVISRQFLEELGVDAVVVAVELPLVEREGCDGTLVADVEDDLIVGLQAVVEPLDLRCHQRGVAHLAHEVTAVGTQLTVVGVEVVAAGVGEEERSLVGAVDIGEVGGVGKGCRTLLKRRSRSEKWKVKSEKYQQNTKDALGEGEADAAATAEGAGGSHRTDGEYLADLAVFLDDSLAVEKAETM